MGNNNRRQFFQQFTGGSSVAETAAYNIAEDKLFQKYANKEMPHGYAKATATLTPYSGAWTETQAMHLLRRATFGLKAQDIDTIVGMGMNYAVDYLINNSNPNPAPPVNNYYDTQADPTGVQPGQTWVNAPYGDGSVNSLRRASLKAWWLGLMVTEQLSIQEKMNFFWHNHFATQTNVIGDARMCYNYHAMLRANSLGNFKNLVKLVTKDPAMLQYLNGYLNNKNAPDENYGRELQELFTVSKYNSPNYTEEDIKQAARVLTGWKINTSTLTSYFDPSQHDTGNKQFSSFYGNAVINGQSGMAGANETDQLIDMIFSKFETAKYICSKLYRFFVYYNIDATIESTVIEPLANLLISSNFEIKPVISVLLKSAHFYDVNNMGCYVRTPLEYVVGTFRAFNVQMPGNYSVADTYNVWNYLRNYSLNLGLDLGDPPNVAGWPAYYQTPQYYELWINSATLPNRMLFTDMAVNSGLSNGPRMNIKLDVLNFVKQCSNAGDPDVLIDYVCSMLLGVAVSVTERDNLKSILLSAQQNNSYWSDAWNEYTSNPTAAHTGTVETRLRSMFTYLLRLAEHHLC
ncbi:MAG: DUF1800 domain-containing protein [Bacteroidetes bacterium]|nr:DUF1800 domain-containing protein [Bacteroidota bacterium]